LKGVRPSGRGHAARCPAHADTRPSLSTAAENGRILVCCHRGCSLSAITAALGLTTGALFLDESSSPTLGTIEATYDYATADGWMLAYQVVRLHPKDFRQRREDPTIPGRWIWNIQGCRKLLYQLPSLCAALEGAIPSRLPRGWVVVVEGERDV